MITIPMWKIRIRLFKKKLRRCGEKLTVGKNVIVKNPELITIGNNVTIGDNSYLNGKGGIEIEDNVILSPNVHIISSSLDRVTRKRINKKVKLCKNVWLCTKSTINLGVTIGENSVVAAHAFVNKDVDPNSLAAGIPAKNKKI